LTKQAQRAATRRLAQCCPELYRLLYAEERGRRGLPPIPLQSTAPFNAERYEAQMKAAGVRFDVDAFYAALGAAGIEVD
jgi:hypothetical protein